MNSWKLPNVLEEHAKLGRPVLHSQDDRAVLPGHSSKTGFGLEASVAGSAVSVAGMQRCVQNRAGL